MTPQLGLEDYLLTEAETQIHTYKTRQACNMSTLVHAVGRCSVW